MISFALDDAEELVQGAVRKLARDVLRRDMRAFEREGRVSDEVEASFLSLGLLSLDIGDIGDPGGGGRSLVTAALCHEELAWGDPGAAVALWTPHVVGHALMELGTREQQARFLPRFLQTGAPPSRGALAYSERWKTRPAGFATSAAPTPEGYVLSGIKSFVLNGGIADLTLVFAQLNPDAGWDGFGVFCVEGLPGEKSYRAGDRHELLGLHAVTAAELVFEEHFVPEENRLRGGGDLQAATTRLFARAQVVGAARQVGLARAAYELALSYTQERRAFGKPVAHFQSVAFSLAEMLMDVDSARWLVWRAAAAADTGAADLVSLAAQAALHANEAAFRVAEGCVQLLGGAGFMEDFPAEKWLRDTKSLSLLSGGDHLHQGLIASLALGLPPELPGSIPQPIFT